MSKTVMSTLLLALYFLIPSNLDAQDFVQTAATALDIAAGPDGSVYIIEKESGSVFQWQAHKREWQAKGPKVQARQIEVDGKGRPWIIDEHQNLAYLSGNRWQKTGTKVSIMGKAYGGGICAPNIAGPGLYEWDLDRSSWSKMPYFPSQAKEILGNYKQNLTFLNQAGKIIFRVGQKQYEEAFHAVDIARNYKENGLYAISASDGKLYNYRAAQEKWKLVDNSPSDLIRLTVDNRNNPWAIDSKGQIWKPSSDRIQYLSGKVYDENNQAVEGAVVEIRSMDFNNPFSIRLTTNYRGHWQYRTDAPSSIINVDDECNATPRANRKTANVSILKKGYLVHNRQADERDLSFTISCPQANENFTFNPQRPKVSILVHGITGGEKKGKVVMDENYQGVNTLQHPQFYWGYNFIRVLLGEHDPRASFYWQTPNGGYGFINRANWERHNVGVLAKAVQNSRNGLQKSDFSKLENEHLMPLFVSNQARSQKGFQSGVLIAYRDGSLPLMKQTQDFINQTYESYQAYFGDMAAADQPMIYLVCHSFGGIVARTLISNPSIKLDEYELSEEERKRADFIRDRIVLITTMATPHQGSQGLIHKEGLANELTKIGEQMDLETVYSTNYQQLELKANTEKELLELSVQNKSVIAGQLINGGNELRKKYNSAACDDILVLSPGSKTNGADYNQSFLHPSLGKRTDGSLIPIYTLTGRNPGSLFYLVRRTQSSAGNHHSRGDIDAVYSNWGPNKIAKEAGKSVIGELVGKSYYKPSKSVWGYPEEQEGDLFSIVQYENDYPYVGSFLMGGLMHRGLYVQYKRDNIYDSDVLVGFDSGHGLKLGTDEMRYFSHTQTYTTPSGEMRGSWYRLYDQKYGPLFPWDFDNHRSYMYNTGVAAFVGSYLLAQAGPMVSKGDFSIWEDGQSVVPLQEKKVHLCIKYLESNNDLLPLDESDLYAMVQIGRRVYQPTGIAEGKNELKPIEGNPCVWRWEQSVKGSLLPIRIEIREKDEGINFGNDIISINSRIYREDLLIYVDLQHGKVYGDVEGIVNRRLEDNRSFEISGHAKDYNDGIIKFTIVVED